MSNMSSCPDLAHDPIPHPLLSEFPSEPYEPRARRRPSSRRSGRYTAPPIPHALATVIVGTTIEHRGLAVTPLIGHDDPACDYLTLEEALSSGAVTIREMSVYGSINKVHVFNRAERPLLIVDGEELSGSVQNRVVNLSVLIDKRTPALVPVSCVERGRCDGETFRFTSASRMQFASGRAEKMAQITRSLSLCEKRQADQVAVWSAVQLKAERLQAVSKTGAMADIYQQHAAALDGYVEALGRVERQRGAVFTVHGRLAGMELFDSASTWDRLMPKIVRSYAIDALEERADQKKGAEIGPDVLLDVVAQVETPSYTSFGDTFDVRIEGMSVTGSALVFGSRVINLAAFNLPHEGTLDIEHLTGWPMRQRACPSTCSQRVSSGR